MKISAEAETDLAPLSEPLLPTQSLQHFQHDALGDLVSTNNLFGIQLSEIHERGSQTAQSNHEENTTGHQPGPRLLNSARRRLIACLTFERDMCEANSCQPRHLVRVPCTQLGLSQPEPEPSVARSTAGLGGVQAPPLGVTLYPLLLAGAFIP